jgi:hypothetical protein
MSEPESNQNGGKRMITAKRLRTGGGILIGLSAIETSKHGVTGPLTFVFLYGMFAIGFVCFLTGEAILLREWHKRRAEKKTGASGPLQLIYGFL